MLQNVFFPISNVKKKEGEKKYFILLLYSQKPELIFLFFTNSAVFRRSVLILK